MKITSAILISILICAVLVGYGIANTPALLNHSNIRSNGLWQPTIIISPSPPQTNQETIITVGLKYCGSKYTKIDPLALRTWYKINITIIDLDNRTVYFNKCIVHNKIVPPEHLIKIKPGMKIGIYSTALIFTDPGKYIIKVTITGPRLVKTYISKTILVHKGSMNNLQFTSNPFWELYLDVSPRNPSTSDNIIVTVTLRYVGNQVFTVTEDIPLIKSVSILGVRGQDYWSIAIPSHPATITIKPGYNETFKFVIGPTGEFPHTFKPGLYRVVVHALIKDMNGHYLRLTKSMYIRIRG